MAYRARPRGLDWRSKPSFIIATVALGLFTDLFLYGIMVPVLPFMLRDRLSIPEGQIQSYTSGMLAAYAGPSVLFSLPAGWIADRLGSRQPTFLAGLLLQLVATTALLFGQRIAVLFLARLVQGLAAAVVWTTGLAMVQDTTDPGNMGRVIGMIFAVVSVSDVAAPVVGGILYDRVGIPGVFGSAIGVLSVDVVMRLLVLDKKTVACRDTGNTHDSTRARLHEREAREDEPLLHHAKHKSYKIQGQVGHLERTLPILYCFREPRFLAAFVLTLVQALIRGIFDATVPTEAQSLFHFSSQNVGLLFFTLLIPQIALSHTVGSTVDKHGTRIVATTGFALMAPCLMLLGLPSLRLVAGDANVVIFCLVLLLNGIGLSMVGIPAFVEAIDVTQRYEAANAGFFGEHGPYAQLYGLSCLFFFAGLTLGPVLGGLLRTCFGYGIMGIVFAAISAATALLSFVVMGDRTWQVGQN